MSLCWKCLKVWERKYEEGRGTVLEPYPWIHCHHDEPEEKPKCWCQNKIIKNGYIYDVNGEIITFHFCPICGRSL